MNLSPEELAILDGGIVRIAMFVRIATDPVIRLWLGVGAISPTDPVLDPGGAQYEGLGTLRNVPEFSQLINGEAERVEFVCSGVSGPLLEKASESAEEIKGKEVAVGFGLMGGDWQLVGDVRWSRVFYADYLALNQAPGENDMVRSISLSCGSLMTGKRRPALSYYSDADQQRRSPGDKFFERVPMYAQDKVKPWPRF